MRSSVCFSASGVKGGSKLRSTMMRGIGRSPRLFVAHSCSIDVKTIVGMVAPIAYAVALMAERTRALARSGSRSPSQMHVRSSGAEPPSIFEAI